MLSKENFCDQLLDELQTSSILLPTLPDVAIRVRNVVNDPEANAASLVKIIATDPALATRLIKVANNPLYRGRMPIDNLQTVISRLGQDLVKNLVLSLALEQMFITHSKAVDEQLHQLWLHSLTVSTLSQLIASQHGSIRCDEAMLAGLIHDIGKLPIIMKAAKYDELNHDHVSRDHLINSLHSRIGEQVLNHWHFSQNLISVVAEHEDLSRYHDGQPDLIDIVQVANIQSYANTEQAISEEQCFTINAFKKLGLTSAKALAQLQHDHAESLVG